MAGLEISEIKEYEDAYEFALGQLAYFIKDILPARKVTRADRDFSVPAEPFITVRPVSITSMNGGSDISIRKMKTITDTDTDISYNLYQWKTLVDLRAHKGSAMADLSRIKQSLNNEKLHYDRFGQFLTVGVGEVRQVQNVATPINEQGMETGASLRMCLFFICKEVEQGLGVIESFSGNISLDDEDIPFATS